MTQSDPAALEHEAPKTPGGGPALARHMGLFSLVVYGVGDMVGSGIYGTVGKAAGQMGNAVWLAFVVSMVAALLTGLSYASISSRYPRAAGAAYVTQRAFRFTFLSYLVGLAVTASGLTSMATSTNVFSGTLADLAGLAKTLGHVHWTIGDVVLLDRDVAVLIVIFLFLAFITFVNFWGIRESMWTNLLCTAVEVGGLLFIIAVGARYWGGVNYLETPRATEASNGLGMAMVMSGAVLTFFSFVGFEDMLNVCEEVERPERTMPWGILLALGVVTLLYIGIAITAVSVANYKELAAAPAPLAVITAKASPWLPAWVFKGITMFAVANTVLINHIMGSRLLYGMARQGLVPAALGRVHHRRRTPHVAIVTLLFVVVVLALLGNVQDLGTSTGLLLLGCFMVVNASLIVLKLRPTEPRGRFEVPVVVPALGILVNGALIVARLLDPTMTRKAQYIAGGIGLGITVMYFVMRPKAISEELPADAAADAGAAAAQ